MTIRALALGILLAASQAPTPDRIRECSAWCVSSYTAEQWSESLSCIDTCQGSAGNHPIALCAKGCVSKNVGKKPEIAACIDRCGR